METSYAPGVVIQRMYLPEKVKITIKRLDKDNFLVHYIETLGNDVPPEVIENTIKRAKHMGVKIKRRGRTLFYKITGPSEAAFGVILGEIITLSKFGDITLKELIILAGMSMGQIQKAKKKAEKKEES